MAGIQMGGLASGLDTTSMIESMMEVERLKVDKVYQQKVTTEWQRDAYIEVSDRYADFILKMRESFGITNAISTNGLTRPGTVDKLAWVNKAISSNESILTAKATSGAKPGKYEVEVNQLADSGKLASSSEIKFDGDTGKLGDLITADGTKLSDVLGADGIVLTVETNKGSKEIKLTSDMSMSDFAKQMDGLDGVSATYDESIGRMFLQTSETGENSFFKISSAGNEEAVNALLGGMHLKSSSGDMLQAGEEVRGQDAIITFNGAENIKFSSNNFQLQGIDFSLQGAKPGEKVSVRVDTDVDAVVDKISTFVKEYNSLVTDVGKILSQKANRDYPPLTEKQKEDMTDKQIELWEEKAKSGLLRNDSLITSIQEQMKSAILQDVTLSDGSTMNLYSIGIQTSGYSTAAASGELVIDEEKLRAAISENSGQVLELFFGTPSTSTDGTNLNKADRDLTSAQIQEKRQQSGLFNRISDILSNGVSQIVNKAGTGNSATTYRKLNSFVLSDFTTSGSKSLLDKRVVDYNKRMTDLNKRLEKVEARYWKKFTAMETALSKLQSQSSSLFSM